MLESTTPQAGAAGPDAVRVSDAVDPELVAEAVRLAARWTAEAAEHPVPPAAARLAKVLRDPAGLPFVLDFVDGVVRPEDLGVAAATLRALAGRRGSFLGPLESAAVAAGGVVGPVAPWLVVPAARRVLRSMVGHLLVDASDERLGPAIARLRTPGVRLNINLLGEAVLGGTEAERRLAGIRRLVARPDVDYVSVKVSSVVAPHNPWAFDETVAHVVDRLRPLFLEAAASGTFVNLDMEEYHDLELTTAVFERLLDDPALLRVEAGIVLQAYLPDALAAMVRLQAWAADRVARGGARIKVRLVKGANLPMERVESELHGWPLATWHTKEQTDTSYKRVLAYALEPERVRHVRLGVAGHNLFDVAHAWLLAGRRGVEDAVEFEMLLGMATGQAQAVLADVGSLLLYTPVVQPHEFDVAIAYLVRRLDEGAAPENFMSAVFDLATSPDLFARERDRFLASVAALDAHVPHPHRTADRYAAVGAPAPGRFVNTPDTDPAVPANRARVREVLARVPVSDRGSDALARATVTDAAALDAAVGAVRTAAEAWGALPAAERAAVLHRVGDALEEHRLDLLEVMAAETGKTADQGDPEVSEAVDFAHHYAELALDLHEVDGARFEPVRVTLVTPPWNFPVAIPAGSTLAALATGSGVVLKPAGEAGRCAAVLAEVLHGAGVPEDVLRLVQVDEATLGPRLVGHPLVDQVILTGAYDTAALFRSFRHDLPLIAETSGKNAIVVTPSADLDLAAADVVHSAFGHAGQKCSAASLVVLVGSVATSQRFRAQLLDAAASLPVGYPQDPSSRMGPLVAPAAGKLLAGLTELAAGERWALEPRRLDGSGRLWSPGIRVGVQPGSAFHRTEYFGPVLGVMVADTLEDAIAIVNDVPFGLTSGLHSLDRDEIATWLEGVHAGNLYVNRGTTGAIVRRQPFGGWKRSAVGPGRKAGGPDHLLPLGHWRSARATAEDAPVAAVHGLLAAARLDLPDDVARLERAARSDAHALRTHLAASDVTGLRTERNVLRHRPVANPVHVRAAAGADLADLVRVVLAAVAAGAPVEVSGATALPPRVAEAMTHAATAPRLETDAAWLDRLRRQAEALDADPAHDMLRVRLVGAPAATVTAATGGRPDVTVWSGPVTESGRLELSPFVREQSVSVCAHRFGTPQDLTAGLLG